MSRTSTTVNRVLIGVAALGIAVGGGAAAAGAATPSHSTPRAHHSILSTRHANESETSREATQDGPGQTESSATDVTSTDSSSGSTDNSSSGPSSDPQNSPDSTPEGTSTDSSVGSVTHSRDSVSQDKGLVGGTRFTTWTATAIPSAEGQSVRPDPKSAVPLLAMRSRDGTCWCREWALLP